MPNGSDPSQYIGPFPLAPELRSEAKVLIDAALNGIMTTDEHKRFERLVIQHPAVAHYYLRSTHLWLSVPLHISHDPRVGITQYQDTAPPEDLLDQTMILPALREIDTSTGDLDVPDPRSAILPQPSIRRRQWWLWGSAAAIFAICAGLFWKLHDSESQSKIAVNQNQSQPSVQTAVATVTATATVDPQLTSEISLGSRFASGEILQISRGDIELTFASGAVATVEGPARLRVANQNAMILERGAITAHVPQSAKGFQVDSPGLTAVDMGTNFGVRAIAGQASSEIDIFEGTVDLVSADSHGQPTSAVIHAVRGQAFRCAAVSTTPPLAIASKPETFLRDINAARVSVAMPDTAVQLTQDGSDKNWQIVSIPNQPNWRPRQASILENLSTFYTRSSPDRTWIGINRRADDQPPGPFVFRATIDLSEYDCSAIEATANIAADDFISDIVVNGVSTGLNTASLQNVNGFFEKRRLVLPAGVWQRGINQVDIVVTNKSATSGTNNTVALHLEWTATAPLTVRR